MSTDMSEEEWRSFVTHGTRTAALATVRRDGRPHVAPIWFVLDDVGSVVFTAPIRSRAHLSTSGEPGRPAD
jgi:hypothetical protein